MIDIHIIWFNIDSKNEYLYIYFFNNKPLENFFFIEIKFFFNFLSKSLFTFFSIKQLIY